MNKRRKQVIKSNEISEIRTYKLGGFPQKVLIDGKKKSNPIVLFLHGGPGTPVPFCAGCRGMFPELTDRVTMVYWDQLGSGINNHLIDDTFTTQHFIDMTIELIKWIKNDFPENKICLFAVSWGSVLASNAIVAVPGLIHACMIYGQVLKQVPFTDDVFEALENASMPSKKKERLSIIKQRISEHRVEDYKTVMFMIRKYTEGYLSKTGGKAPIGDAIWGPLTSPDYTIKDCIAILINGFSRNQSLFKELMDLDLSDTLAQVSVPYHIFQGDKDLITSTAIMESYMDNPNQKNPNLSLEIVAESGHMPSRKGLNIVKNGFEFYLEKIVKY